LVHDILSYDGVIHAVDRIILPRRRRGHHGGHHHKHHDHHGAEEDVEMEVEEWVEGFAEDEDWTIENLRRIFGDE